MGKRKTKSKSNSENHTKRQLVFKEDGTEYCEIIKILGNGRFTGNCFDGKERLVGIRGNMRKRVWIKKGDFVLVGLRDFQDSKADIILKYTDEEVKMLRNYEELPSNISKNNDDNIEFTHDVYEEEIIIDDI